MPKIARKITPLLLLALIALLPGRLSAQSAAELATGAMANFVFAKQPIPAPQVGFVDGEGRTVSLEDFRGDKKWPEYLDFCNRFFFAVPQEFPIDVLPEDCGLMTADAYGALVLRDAPERPLNAARRKAQNLRFALVAAERLQRHLDPRDQLPA